MLKVSVIIPIYNTKKWLNECLKSLVCQSLKECEFICIDDGSTDDSYKIVENYKRIDKRFILIRQQNCGLAETRNVGIRKAQGKYIVFLDSDDYYTHKYVLETLYKEAEEKGLEVISFETELIYENFMKKIHNKDFYYDKKNIYKGIQSGKALLINMMSNQEYCDSSCFLFLQREWLLRCEIMFYSGILYEDGLFCMQCFLQAKRMIHLSEKFYVYRVRENSIMTTQSHWENVRSRIVLYREMLRLLYLPENSNIELQKAMEEYISLTVFHAKYLDEFRVDEQPNEKLSPLDMLFLKSMELGKYRKEVNEQVILCGLEKIVENSRGIILYGAGNIGTLFYKFLKDKGLKEKILCYAVSQSSRENVYLNDIRVLSVGEAVKKSGLIFLSVIDSQVQKDMIHTLEGLGVDKFEIFDQYMYRALRHYSEDNCDTGSR